ncbi:MAG: hypothetical protein SGILL_009814 [Bacillariaceae sp.]
MDALEMQRLSEEWKEEARERENWGSEPMEPTPEPEEELRVGKIYYLYNNDYGGFGWSKRAREELARRGCNETNHWDCNTERTDPIAVALFNEMGSKWCSGEYCEMARTTVPEKYLEYVELSEYDGDESVRVNYDKAFTQGVRKLLDEETATLEDIRAYVTGIEKDQGCKFYYPGLKSCQLEESDDEQDED